MRQEQSFLRAVCRLAVPAALQSMLQASFSIVDQIMIGQLGSVNVAGIGLAGKFSSIYSVIIAAVGTAAGIMISQYMGQGDRQKVRKSFYLNLAVGAGIAVGFTGICTVFPSQIMSLYTKDLRTASVSAGYLTIIGGTFLPMAGAVLLSTMFRCMEMARLPLYAGIASAVCNTGLNYILIFGKCGCAPMGVKGAAAATLISQFVNVLIMAGLMLRHGECLRKCWNFQETASKFNWKQYFNILFPVLACEFMWSLGENVYAVIYGRVGTEASAAMTLTNPVQGLMIGALCGLSQAAGVIVGKKLGNKEYEEAYRASEKLIWYGFAGSAVLSLLLVILSGYYVEIYQVESHVKQLTRHILYAYAVIAPFKVENMILGGGIIRSGGKTKYIMFIDMIGTWLFGVPLGLAAAFVLHLSIPYVYFMLSLEECVRFGISVVVFRRRKWMQKLGQ